MNEHLGSCPACRAELEALKRDLAVVSSLVAPEPGPYLATRVMAEVRAHAPRRGFSFGRALSTAIASFIVLAGVGIGALIGRGLAHPSAVATTAAEELTVSNDVPAFVDVFESALAGE